MAIRAWHFVRENARLGHGAEDIIVEPGFVYSEPGQPQLCRHGMHASIRAFDALTHAPGPVVCRVDVWGRVQHGDDKLVGQHREVLAMANVERELRLFARWCVRETPIGDGRKVWDLIDEPRNRTAIETIERFAIGQASQGELVAPWEAAREAPRAAAWEAAREAAHAAAWADAREAPWEAAREAARAAAWEAAYAAAWAAAREFQAAEFERIMLKAIGEAK
jgi:hypothetical protein